VEAECRHFAPFEVSARGLGGFPSITHARVLWMGLTNPPGLKELQRAIDNSTADLGFPGENRPFSPHLTLGRVGDSVTPKDLDKVISFFYNSQNTEYGTFFVNEVHVDRSDLQSGGAKYTRLSTSQLKLTH
jgi:2'-5' RNA ligase